MTEGCVDDGQICQQPEGSTRELCATPLRRRLSSLPSPDSSSLGLHPGSQRIEKLTRQQKAWHPGRAGSCAENIPSAEPSRGLRACSPTSSGQSVARPAPGNPCFLLTGKHLAGRKAASSSAGA